MEAEEFLPNDQPLLGEVEGHEAKVWTGSEKTGERLTRRITYGPEALLTVGLGTGVPGVAPTGDHRRE